MAMRFTMDDGWKRYARGLDPKRFEPALQKHVGKATLKNAHIVQKRIRQGMQTGRWRRNVALTIMIKRDTKPLIGLTGDLFQAIAVRQIDWSRAFVGVLRTAEEINVAQAVHDGAAIRVTPRMRMMFHVLWLASQGRLDPNRLRGRAAELWRAAPGGWLPLSPSTTTIVIPSRPFIRRVFEKRGGEVRIKRNWLKAVQAAVREASR